MPKVSICIPSYNHALYIKQALDSALSQEFRDFNVIVVDDSSTDESWNLLESTVNRKLSVSRNEKRLGITKNWNKCCRMSDSEYIVMLPSDDRLDIRHLKTLVPIMDQNPNIGFCGTAASYIGPLDQSLGEKYRNRIKKGQLVISNKRWQLYTYAFGPRVMFPGTIFRRDLYERIGGFNEQMQICEDWDFWLKCLHYADEGFLNQKMFYFRWTPFNLSGQIELEDLRFSEAAMIHRFLLENAPNRVLAYLSVGAARSQLVTQYLKACKRKNSKINKAMVLKLLGLGK